MDGAFEPTAAPGERPTPLLPWTVQARVSDLAVLAGRLYLGVNARGLASLEKPRATGGQPAFRYYYDPLLFRYRTLTTLVPAADSLACHLYFNSLLNVTTSESLPMAGVCLLRLHPQEGVYQPIAVPFLIRHPGWEGVGFAPLSTDIFLFEWKLAGLERTDFEYTSFAPATLAERPSDRKEYRQACEPEKKLPPDLEPLAQELVRRAATEPGAAPAVHFLVRTAGEPLPRRYARTPPGFARDADARLLTAYGFRGEGRSLLLAPDGLLLADAGPREISARLLPPLPGGFAYTGLFVLEELLVAPWEQTDFTRTGAAGIFISGQL